MKAVHETEVPSVDRKEPPAEREAGAPLHVIKDYKTEKGRPICLHENRFFRMVFNGYFHYLEGVAYAEGAVAVPTMPNGDLVLVRLRRAPALGFSIEFPRGGIDKGEGIEAGCARELSEETGFEADLSQATRIGRIAQDSATLNGFLHAVHLPVNPNSVVKTFDSREISAVLIVPQSRFEEMLADGTIFCGITQAAWALYKARETHKANNPKGS